MYQTAVIILEALAYSAVVVALAAYVGRDDMRWGAMVLGCGILMATITWMERKREGYGRMGKIKKKDFGMKREEAEYE